MNLALKVAILRRGPQWQVAQAAEMDSARLSHILHGRVRPRGDEVERLAAVLDVPADVITGEQPATVEAAATA